MTTRYDELLDQHAELAEELAELRMCSDDPDNEPELVELMAQIQVIEHEIDEIEQAREAFGAKAPASEAIANRRNIEDYTVEELNAIARALHDEPDEGSFEAVRHDAFTAMMRLCDVADTSTPVDPDQPDVWIYVQAELAQAVCHAAFFNGRRTREKLEAAVKNASRRVRESTMNDVDLATIESANKTVRGLQQRLLFWRAAYKAAQDVHAHVAAMIDQPWMASRWQTPSERAAASAARRVTASAAETMAYAARWTGYVPSTEERMRLAEQAVEDPYQYEPPYSAV